MDENIPVIPIPGPSAFLTALSASGLSTDEFTFGNSFCEILWLTTLLWMFGKF